MKKNNMEKFIDKLMASGIPIDYPMKMESSHMALAEARAHIKCGCDFKEGACVRQRMLSSSTCCCSGCAREVGFLKRISLNKIKLYSTRWDSKRGFLGERGCRLSLAMRSGVCLGYRCHFAEQNAKLSIVESCVLKALLDGPT